MKQEQLLALLAQMTIEEKLGQMTQLTPDFFGIDSALDLTGPLKSMNIGEEDIKYMGSTLNGHGAARVKAMQDRHLACDRNKIPLLIMADVVHGFKTSLPIPLAMAASFDPTVPEHAAALAARECTASGVQVTFAPMTDLVRDPRWGRVMESPGEDPYLNSVMTAAAVRGFQGTSPKEKGKLAACVKHFAAYGAPEGGRDYNTVDISDGMLHEYYLSAYKAAIDAGVAMVMSSFNLYERVPATINTKLMRGILRDKWGFQGVTISDYSSIDETITHGICRDGAEAAQMGITAGTDIEMTSTHFYKNAAVLLEEGKLDIALIDEAVLRILELKNALGLFENPYKDADEQAEQELLMCDAHLEEARRLAGKCQVLLKNDGDVLPLKKNAKLGLVGPFADTEAVLGGWALSAKGASTLCGAILEELGADRIPMGMTAPVMTMRTKEYRDIPDEIESALEAVKDCDVVIAALGESSFDSGEAASKTNLRLSDNQEALLRALKKAGKKVVTLIYSGRPLELRPILPYTDAILQVWFLGTESSHAISDVLFGRVNPSGRLTLSFPQTVGQIPVYYNHFSTGRPLSGPEDADLYKSKYLDCPNEALFPFGYGLSYSKFSYSNFCVGGRTVAVDVENTSEVAGTETVQLYVRDVVASVVRPLKELKDFRQITLAPHEKQTVCFTVTDEMLMFYRADLSRDWEEGEFDLMIGRNSAEVFTQRVYYNR